MNKISLIRLTLVPAFILFLNISCSITQVAPGSCNIKFIVFGNTYPASPYHGVSELLGKAVDRIFMMNPAIVIHTGNTVHGGHSWMGLKEFDLYRQYKENSSILSRIEPILYRVVGEKDLFNGKTSIFRKYSKRNIYYSFNYGNLHLIVLNTRGSSGEIIDKKQMKWLKADLETYKRAKSILIFTHYPLISYKKKKYTLKDDKLHDLFLKYPVKAVLSGKQSKYYTFKKDRINYIVLGCSGYSNYRKNRTYNHFYVINYDCNILSIEPKSLHLNKKK